MPTDTLSIADTVHALEERLRAAMLASDVNALGALIADRLIFTNQLGQVFGKEDDLATHRSGLLTLTAMDPSELQVQVFDASAVVSVRMRVAGSFGGTRFGADLRYTRVWQQGPTGDWQVVTAHCSEVR